MSTTGQFERSARAFIDLVRAVPTDAWDGPGLGQWSLRSLVGHTTRAILTVEQYLHLEQPDEVNVPDAEAYYSLIAKRIGDPDAVLARGVAAGEWLGDDPVHRITDALGRATTALELAGADHVVPIGGLGIPLSEYLRTRVFELVVHSADVARAIGVVSGMPEDAVRDSLLLAASTAFAQGTGDDVLAALTGRGELPAGFSVV
jgi:uncharacterized protein (TIGR03083 family)